MLCKSALCSRIFRAPVIIDDVKSVLVRKKCTFSSSHFLCKTPCNLPLELKPIRMQYYKRLKDFPICSYSLFYEDRRSYSKKRKSYIPSDPESSDEELEDVLDKFDKNAKIIRTHLSSLRLDAVIKSALGMGRNKVDVIFYESRIRVNGEKVFKKSQRVNVGDEIDVIKGVSNVNPDILTIARIEVISAEPDEEEIYVKLRRFKSLQIENYENAPYKEASEN